jgi:hypothetical protein
MLANALPRLRYRVGDVEKVYAAPTAIIGDVVDVDFGVVTIVMRSQVTKLYLEDLHDALGGPEMAFGLLLNAAGNSDRVRITLHRDKITYDNAAQLARFKGP